MITLARFRLLEAALIKRGFGPSIEWTEALRPPENADAFAEAAIYVVCNSGMANTVAQAIFERCMAALQDGGLASDVFGHPGKRAAIDCIWAERAELFAAYLEADDKLAQLQTLPFIGEITALHLAKNLGANVAKPDVHLERLARREGVSSQELCARLAAETGYRAATIDTVLWRACALKVLRSQIYEAHGWDAAFEG